LLVNQKLIHVASSNYIDHILSNYFRSCLWFIS